MAADGEGSSRVYRAAIHGAKGGSSRTPVEAPNTLQAKSLAFIVDLLGEGPNVGVVDPATGNPGTGTDVEKGILYSDAPLRTSGDVSNYPGTIVYERIGDPDQPYIPEFDAVETPNGGAFPTQIVNATPLVRRITDPNTSRARVGIRIPALTKVNASTGDINGNRVIIKIEVKADADDVGSEYVQRVYDVIDGKTNSPYERAYGITLDGVAPWDIRVTRVSPDDASSTSSSQTYLQYISQIIDARLNYADRHVVAHIIDSQQFGGQIPQRNFIVKGRIIKVPSNYNPVTRVYTGEWDGLFVDAWTNNPAWIVYDLLTNARYGIGEDIVADDIEAFDFYQAAQYCDELVDDGQGGTEPRFTFNASISSQQDAITVIQSVAGMFRSSLIWGGERFSLMTNKPKTTTNRFTRANVKDGKFTYQGTSLAARHTVALVDWINPALGYENDIMPVELPEAIDRYGYNELKITAVGCTSPGQAYRQGLAALYAEWLETDTVTFECGITDAGMTLGSVIGIADPIFTAQRRGGRLLAVANTTNISLDSAYTFDGARDYTILIQLPTGVWGEYTVVNPSAAATDIVLSAALDSGNMPVAGATWILTDDLVQERKFYVMGLTEGDGDEWIKVIAIQYEQDKFDLIDGSVVLPANGAAYSDVNKTSVDPIDAATFTLTYGTRNVGNSLVGQVVGSWLPVDQAGVRGYAISYQYGYGPIEQLPETKATTFTFDSLERTRLTVWVRTVNQFGYKSDAIFKTIDLDTSSAAGKTLISALQVQGGGSNWTGRDINIEWEALPSTLGAIGGDTLTTGWDQEFLNFRVRVYTSNGGTLLGTLYTTDTKITVTYDQLLAWGTIQRSYYITVALQDVGGVYSNSTGVTFSNPAPSLPTVVATTGPGSVTLTFSQPNDPDYVGIRVWASTTNGFVASGTTPGTGNCVWDGGGSPVLVGAPGVTIYYKYAAYDAWGATSLNVSTQQSAVHGSITASAIAAGAVDIASFAAGLAPVEIVASLPVTGNYTGRTVMLTTDGNIYRYYSGAFVKSVAAADITGTLATAQIATSAITSTLIAAGAVGSSQLAAGAVIAGKIAAGTIVAADIAANTITASQIAAATITATQIAALTITSGLLAANSVIAGKIAAAAVSTTELAAGAVRADKLAVVQVGSALNEDPGMLDSSAWSVGSGSFTTVTDGKVGNGVFRTAAGTLVTMLGAKKIPVDLTKTYRVRAWVRTVSGSGSTMYLGVALYDNAGANISSGGGSYWYNAAVAVTPPGTWTEYSAVFGPGVSNTYSPLSSSARTFVPMALLSYGGGTGVQEITDFRIEEVLPGTLIQDSSISTAKIIAGAITTNLIAAGAVVAGSIAANSITADKLFIGQPGACLNQDPYFADSSAWSILAGSGLGFGTGYSSGVAGTTYAYNTVAGTQVWAADNKQIPIVSGRTYRFSGWFALAGGANGRVYVGWGAYNSAGTYLGADWGVNFANPGGSFTQYSGNYTADAILAVFPTAKTFKLVCILSYPSGGGTNTSVHYAQDIRVEEVLPSVLIQDGAITAAKISVSSLSAINANLGAITAGTITLTSGSYVRYDGAGIGASSDLLLWFGSSGTAMGSATKTNAKFAIANDGLTYHLGKELVTMFVTVSPTSLNTGRAGAGSATTSACSAGAVTGGDGTYTYAWSYVSGDSFTINSPTSSSTTFTGTVAALQSKTGIYLLTVTETATGRTAKATVSVHIFDTT